MPVHSFSIPVLSELHHVGHLTDDYERAITYYCDVLSGTIEETTTVEDAVEVAFITWSGFRVEVVARKERGTYLDPLLDNLLAISPYHLAATVPDIEETMAELERRGYPMFDKEPVDGLGPYVRAFVAPDAVPAQPLELIELRDE